MYFSVLLLSSEVSYGSDARLLAFAPVSSAGLRAGFSCLPSNSKAAEDLPHSWFLPRAFKLLVRLAGPPPILRFSCSEPTLPSSPVRMWHADQTVCESWVSYALSVNSEEVGNLSLRIINITFCCQCQGLSEVCRLAKMKICYLDSYALLGTQKENHFLFHPFLGISSSSKAAPLTPE